MWARGRSQLSPGFAIPSVITTALETLNKASGRAVDRSAVSGFCLATCTHASEPLRQETQRGFVLFRSGYLPRGIRIRFGGVSERDDRSAPIGSATRDALQNLVHAEIKSAREMIALHCALRATNCIKEIRDGDALQALGLRYGLLRNISRVRAEASSEDCIVFPKILFH